MNTKNVNGQVSHPKRQTAITQVRPLSHRAGWATPEWLTQQPPLSRPKSNTGRKKEHCAQGTEEGEELTEREGVGKVARDKGWQLGGLILRLRELINCLLRDEKGGELLRGQL